MSIMTELTAKGTWEVGLKFIVSLPLTSFFFSPPGVLSSSVLVSPSRLVLFGVISALTWVVIVLVFSFLFWHYSIDGLDLSYLVV
jgi:hypothetical protein